MSASHPTETLASAFDEETELVRRGSERSGADDDDFTLRGPLVPEPAPAPAPTTLLPAAPVRRRRPVLWLAGLGAALGIAAALAAQAL